MEKFALILKIFILCAFIIPSQLNAQGDRCNPSGFMELLVPSGSDIGAQEVFHNYFVNSGYIFSEGQYSIPNSNCYIERQYNGERNIFRYVVYLESNDISSTSELLNQLATSIHQFIDESYSNSQDYHSVTGFPVPSGMGFEVQ